MAARCEFKDLCLDVADAVLMGRFWAGALGLHEPQGRHQMLFDDVDTHALWLNRVLEPKTVKHRVHLDVHAASVEELVATGARVVDETQPWTELVDPEGGEFDAFVRPPDRLPRYRVYELVVDAADPERIAGWWASRFGTEPQSRAGEDFRWLDPASGLPWEMVFTHVPEPKTVKNRLHWDVYGVTAELLDEGARLLRSRDDEIAWDVLADPEGNEFCVFTPGRDTAP
jgi:Glyoxalase-like domain